jgi:vacuolar-type H+-ATPase subunit H
VTDRLESLQEAEIRARQTVEDARREAQKLRLGISSQIEELETRKNRNLVRSRESARKSVDEVVTSLESELDSRASVLLSELEQKKVLLDGRAVELLTEIILRKDGAGK